MGGGWRRLCRSARRRSRFGLAGGLGLLLWDCLAARYVDVDNVGTEALDVLRIFQVDHVAGLLRLGLTGDVRHFLVVVLDAAVHDEVLVRGAPAGGVLVDEAIGRVLLVLHGLTHHATGALGRVAADALALAV